MSLSFWHDTIQISEKPWPAWKRLSFRFLLCYIALYCVGLLGDVISFCVMPFSARLKMLPPFPSLLWGHVVPWFGEHILHLGPITVSNFGSGDTLYDWVQVLCELILAFITAGVWTWLDRSRLHSSKFSLWLRVAVRALLAAEMILYGLDKVFPLQFKEMTLARMMQPMASMTPMDVLWNFMAVSVGYTIFTGLIEVLGGVLLLVPAWTTLGSLICMVSMTNVVALNLAYDIPVKRGSSHLLLLSLFLVAPSLPRLARFFLLNREIPARSDAMLSRRRLFNQAALWIPVSLCCVVFCAGCTYGIKQMRKQGEAHLQQSRFYGIWDLASFTVADPSRPLFTEKLITDMNLYKESTQWRRVIFERPDSAVIQLGDGRLDYVDMHDGTDALTLTDSGDPEWKCSLKLHKSGAGLLEMDGTINGNPVHAILRREDETQFVLTRRRFHLVNEW